MSVRKTYSAYQSQKIKRVAVPQDLNELAVELELDALFYDMNQAEEANNAALAAELAAFISAIEGQGGK